MQGNTSRSKTYGFRPSHRPLTKKEASPINVSILGGIASLSSHRGGICIVFTGLAPRKWRVDPSSRADEFATNGSFAILTRPYRHEQLRRVAMGTIAATYFSDAKDSNRPEGSALRGTAARPTTNGALGEHAQPARATNRRCHRGSTAWLRHRDLGSASPQRRPRRARPSQRNPKQMPRHPRRANRRHSDQAPTGH